LATPRRDHPDWSRLMNTSVGQRFERWTVLQLGERAGSHPAALCVCDCGTERIVRTELLRIGKSKSCGCYRDAAATTHGRSHTSMHNIWLAMRRRCYLPSDGSYERYGGRGIKVCDRWQIFENFLADMGERPSDKHSIERENNEGNYEPGNCIWAVKLVQANNTRSNVYYTLDGETLTLAQWARKCGMNYKTVHARIKRGWSLERALLPRFVDACSGGIISRKST
jgi:hypothetical protein